MSEGYHKNKYIYIFMRRDASCTHPKGYGHSRSVSGKYQDYQRVIKRVIRRVILPFMVL